MKSRLHKIEIRNFKAFREFTLNLEGSHLLVYGANGAGKSSLYWALYTFLQSARKSRSGIAKYFTPGDGQSLLNIHEQAQPSPMPGEIAMTLRDVATKNDTVYRINQNDHGTYNQPTILKGELASDFITYRFFFGFSDFRNSQKFNIWPLFEQEILPFCVTTAGANKSPLEMWNAIKSGDPNPWGKNGRAGTYAYSGFRAATRRFAAVLPGIVDAISVRAQSFYDAHFANDDTKKGDTKKMTLKLGLTVPPSSSGNNLADFKFIRPEIEFGIQIDGQTITRPQSFLNEAKLTQFALSVRFAASLVNLNESDLKLLVLDDLLVSLDMSNRMKVVEILLSETFAGYQKIILTHELGFFREFRRAIGANQHDWHCARLEGTSFSTISCHSEKTDTQKAEEYLHGHSLDEAALCLRKACEDTAKRFIGHSEVVPTKEFLGLAAALRVARDKVLHAFPVEIYEKVVRNTPDQHRNLLIATSDDDLDANTALDQVAKGRLKTNRNRLRKLVTVEHVERLRQIKLIDDILASTERVLNPAAHAGTPPLYEKEVHDALLLVKQLETTLS